MIRRSLGLGAVLALLCGCSAGGSGSSLLGSSTGGSSGTSDSAPGAGIFGRVVDEAEAAIEGASVELLDGTGARLAGPVVTDRDGAFDLAFTGQELDGGVLYVKPPLRPEARADVTVPNGARIEVLVTLQPDGGITVVPVLEPPTTAPSTGTTRSAPVLLKFTADGVSDPFRLTIRGQFDPDRADLRLVYRARGEQLWRVGGTPKRQLAPLQVPLQLGPSARSFHGRVLEIRALAAPPGRLAGVTTFTGPQELGRDVVMSPEPVHGIVVATRDGRLDQGSVLSNAVVVAGMEADEVSLSSADLTSMGLKGGDRVRLTTPTGTVILRVRQADDEVMRLATLRLSPHSAGLLGLKLGEQSAGYTIRYAPERATGTVEQPPRPPLNGG